MMRIPRFSTLAVCLLVMLAAGAANAQSPKIHILGPAPVADSGKPPITADFDVEVFFDYPLVVCPTNQPDCNRKSVPVCVGFHTVAETATDADFVPISSGTLTKTLVFDGPGEANLGVISVQIRPDQLTEGEETFKVVLTDQAPTACENRAAIGTREARATIIDTAPPPPPAKPDLKVTAIRLLTDCKIELTVANLGPGSLPDSAYNPTQGAAIQMRRNTEAWGGIRLAGVDPGKTLKAPGTSIKHVWFPNAANLSLRRGTHKLSVTIDQNNVVAEANEGNNTTVRTVICKR